MRLRGQLKNLLESYNSALLLSTQAGHTAKTAADFYANDADMNKEVIGNELAVALQQVLGCAFLVSPSGSHHIQQQARSQDLHRFLYKLGYKAFREQQLQAQEWMHCTYSTLPKNFLVVVSPTGSGKSLLWEMLPLVVQALLQKRKTALILSPTIALSIACAGKAQERYSNSGLHFSVSTEYDASKIPSLLFLSISSFSNNYAAISNDENIGYIFVDEFQFGASDSSFRSKDWEGVRMIPTFAPRSNIQVIYSTASFPKAAQSNILKQLNILDMNCFTLLHDSRSDILQKHKITVLGETEEVEAVLTPLVSEILYTHVICSTKEKAYTLHNRIGSGSSAVITSDSPRLHVERILSEWTSGKFRTLISTSTAVAGVDSSHVQRVIFYGMPYSLMFIHQGIGRLRQSGSVIFVVDLSCDTASVEGLPTIFCQTIAKMWLLTSSCRWQAFNKMFSGLNCHTCNVCDVCLRSRVLKNSQNIGDLIERKKNVIEKGRQFYSRCFSKCGACYNSSCSRCCINGCYICGSSRHFGNNCGLDKSVFHNKYSKKLCFICYRYQEGHHINGQSCHTHLNKNMFKNFILKRVINSYNSIENVCDSLFSNAGSFDEFLYNLGEAL